MNVRQFFPANDIEKVLQIEYAAWGEFSATESQIIQRYLTFPEGSIVVENSKKKIIGYAASQLVDKISTSSWVQQTDDGFIKNTHRDKGTIAYGVGMSALPEGATYEGGVATAIIGHYFEQFIDSGKCQILCLGSRLPGFAKWQKRHGLGIDEYLKQDFKGLARDPELRLYQKNGFELLWKIPNYFPDPESKNYGAMIYRK